MPLSISDEVAPSLKIYLLGTTFSAIAYGIVIVLSGNCFHLLQQKRGIYSNRVRIILLIYVTAMLLLSTYTLIQSICVFIQDLTPQKIPSLYLSVACTVPLVVWGVDGFMVKISILCQ